MHLHKLEKKRNFTLKRETKTNTKKNTGQTFSAIRKRLKCNDYRWRNTMSKLQLYEKI